MPWGTAIGLGLLLIVSGSVIAIVAAKARNGTLGRNWIVGVRTRKTLESDAAWTAAHEAAAPPLRLAAAGPLASGILLLFRPSNIAGLVVISIGLVWMVAWVIRGGVLGQRAANEAP